MRLHPAVPKHWLATILALWGILSFAQSERSSAAPQPARIVTRYTLVSAPIVQDYDPSAWRLLGSNDGGDTWTVLDVRTNQEFRYRGQGLAFRVHKPGAYNVYRLQIDGRFSRNVSVDMGVQVGDVNLTGPLVNVAGDAELQPIITSSRPHPLIGLPENAFDQDPSTKWEDYGLGSSNGCWLQIRYAYQSETVVTNISQANRLTHLLADQDWLADKGPRLLASLADASSPRRKLVGYTLTAANDEPDRDPRDWKLLGSNDGGRTWAVLDTRINQTFAERFQRRAFRLADAAACRLYRLQVDSVVRPGSDCQLGEVEPIFADAGANGEYSIVVGSNGENPPLESAVMAFDGDPKTKWLFLRPVVASLPAWIQWQCVPREESMPVISQHQLDRLACSLAAGKLLNPTNIPLVAVKGYALTSANDWPSRDPRDWKLEGSSDGGKTWRTLDIRRQEKFAQRHQRRVFDLTNSVACQWFRLEVESVYDPPNANSMQLAGLALCFADAAAAAHWTALIRCQGENAPQEAAANLFDSDQTSKWLDFTGPESTRASWIEWCYAVGGSAPAVNLASEELTRSLSPKHCELRLDAAVVFVDTNAGAIGLVDETGFQRFQLSPWPEGLAPGLRLNLSGDLQTKGGALRVSNARVASVQPLPATVGFPATSANAAGEAFATGTITGRVEGVFYGRQYSGATLTTSNGPPLQLRVIGSSFPRLPSLDCPVIVRGVVERLLDEKGEREPAVLWVATPQAIALAPKAGAHDSPTTGATNEPPLLTRISEVREFVAAHTNQDARARIQGVITYIDLNLGDFYLQNGEDGILISGQLNAGLSSSLSQEGNYVELDVTVHEGWPFATSFVHVLGKGRFPQPARPSWDRLMTGENDSRWVEVEGVVTAGEGQRLTLSISGGQLIVWINDLGEPALRSIVGSLVRVRGVCSPVVNARQQRLGVRLLLPSSEFVEILNPARQDPFNAPSVPIADIMRADYQIGGLPAQFVKTEGVVTCRQPRLVFIQDGANGLRVSLSEEADVAPGDKVEAVGWPQPDGFSPKLGQAAIRRVGRDVLPPPQPLDLLTNNASDMEQERDATRVEIEAVLLGQSVAQSVCVLNLQNERAQQVFCAYVPLTNAEQRLSIPVGSRLRLQGVFKTIRDKAPDIGQAVTAFEMYLNSPADIVVTARPNWWTARHTLWLIAAFAAVLALVLAWVGLLRNQVRQRTHDLRLEIGEHQRAEGMLAAEIVERKRVQAEADQAHGELLVAARQAGMAEVATGVLHNVGNVLNSVNVSSTLVANQVRQMNSEHLTKAVTLLRQHEHDLTAFLIGDAKGKQLLPYLEMLASHLAAGQAGALQELGDLARNIEHIKEIVAVQQSYASYAGLTEPVQVVELVEDALRMNSTSLERHDVRIIRTYDSQPPVVNADKHKILQILVNLIRNARQACDETGRDDKQMEIRVTNEGDTVKISATDNGVGIPAENLSRIFNHGFTTRKNGHGFGLHSAALAAKAMGGDLRVSSSGPGQGATFTLELPLPKPDPSSRGVPRPGDPGAIDRTETATAPSQWTRT